MAFAPPTGFLRASGAGEGLVARSLRPPRLPGPLRTRTPRRRGPAGRGRGPNGQGWAGLKQTSRRGSAVGAGVLAKGGRVVGEQQRGGRHPLYLSPAQPVCGAGRRLEARRPRRGAECPRPAPRCSRLLTQAIRRARPRPLSAERARPGAPSPEAWRAAQRSQRRWRMAGGRPTDHEVAQIWDRSAAISPSRGWAHITFTRLR